MTLLKFSEKMDNHLVYTILHTIMGGHDSPNLCQIENTPDLWKISSAFDWAQSRHPTLFQIEFK
jgi:hypothetical protein